MNYGIVSLTSRMNSKDEGDFCDYTPEDLQSCDILSILPMEIQIKILQFLDIQTLCTVASVNKRLNRLANHDNVWGYKIAEHFGQEKLKEFGSEDKKQWFLYQICVNPYYAKVAQMTKPERLELQFEETLREKKISYNSWALPFRIVHGPFQNNISIFLLLLQTLLVFFKLEGTVDVHWVVVLSPVWVFDIYLFLCTIMWFYFLSKGVLKEDFADRCLCGWIKDVLNGLRMGHIWFDYMLFVIVSSFLFFLFPLLLVFQLDVFSALYFNIKALAQYELATLPWLLVFSPLIASVIVVLWVLHRRINHVSRFRKFDWFPILKFLYIEISLGGIFFLLLGLHLDGLVPEGWQFWFTFAPLFIASIVFLLMVGSYFDHNEEGVWNGHFRMDANFMAKSPLISLLSLFLVFLVVRLESIDIYGYKENYLFSFCYLFAVESLVVLYWLQDIIDFGGYKAYDTRKRFDFSLSAAILRQGKLHDD